MVAVGTGAALKLGEDCNADVWPPARARAIVHERRLWHPSQVMYNDFVVVGPPADPAGIGGMTSASDAFTQIAADAAPFISRRRFEHHQAERLGGRPKIRRATVLSAGQGMEAVLSMADEQQAYTPERPGNLSGRTLEGTDLVIEVEGDPILFNPTVSWTSTRPLSAGEKRLRKSSTAGSDAERRR
ncbi:MAG: hypothetical protein M9927_10250 [Anaerolineae bacterium]|nr:hypothetical protein [Anaerolineae bacterium]